MVVEKRVRKKHSKNKKKPGSNQAHQENLQLLSTDEDKANCWNEIENEIKNMLQVAKFINNWVVS